MALVPKLSVLPRDEWTDPRKFANPQGKTSSSDRDSRPSRHRKGRSDGRAEGRTDGGTAAIPFHLRYNIIITHRVTKTRTSNRRRSERCHDHDPDRAMATPSFSFLWPSRSSEEIDFCWAIRFRIRSRLPNPGRARMRVRRSGCLRLTASERAVWTIAIPGARSSECRS